MVDVTTAVTPRGDDPPKPPRSKTGETAGAQRSTSEPLWRALAVFRFASVGYAAVRLAFIDHAVYSRPDWAWAAIAVMTAWTVFTTVGYTRRGRRRRVLVADLVVTVGLILSTFGLQYPTATQHGTLPVTTTWMAGPVLAWAISYGRRAGTIAAVIVACADLALVRHAAYGSAVNGAVLLLLAGWLVGHLARLAAEVETERRRVIEVEAASRERERLARGIHDSVLQVLALVQRRGAEAGGAAAELGRLAGQQEAALRALVADDWASRPVAEGRGDLDLRQLVLPAQTDRVTVSVPAPPVRLDEAAATELAAAIRAALDNVRRHCGEQARAWVLVEDEPELVRVTVRDDGPGIPAGRLAAAAAAGRLGISQSISGRMRDLGGTAEISSVPGEGTVVELRLPRGSAATSPATLKVRT